MIELFSDDWGKSYMAVWNADKDITITLAKVDFSSIVTFGFDGEKAPSFCMTIEKGKIVSIGERGYGDVNWDLRATKEDWIGLIAKPPGLMSLAERQGLFGASCASPYGLASLIQIRS